MAAVLAVYVIVLLATGVVTALKGKWLVLALGLVVWPAWILGSLRLARPSSLWARRFYGDEKRRRAAEEEAPRRRMALVAGLASLALLAAFFALAKAYRIPSSAMEPTLRCARPEPGCSAGVSDRVLARRFLPGERPGHGDIVVFELPQLAVERCGAGGVFVKRVIGLPGERVGSRLVPPGHYWVLGDNRPHSCDSSVWGALPEDKLIAKAIGLYWPPGRIGRLD